MPGANSSSPKPGSVREAIFGQPGVCTTVQMSAEELTEFRELITAHWLKRLAVAAPVETLGLFRNGGLANYHRFADRVNHKSLWPKTERLLPPEAIAAIRRMSFMQTLAAEFGPFDISNEEETYPEEIYWRIVRPGCATDVGPVHADAWFWELGHGKTPADTIRVKVWIPFYCEPGMNGLKVRPGSHHEDWPFHGEMRDGYVKPQVGFDEAGLPMELLNVEPGTLVVFHDRLLHGGAFNSGSTTRVSAEFTMFVKRERLLKMGLTPQQLEAPREPITGPLQSLINAKPTAPADRQKVA